MSTLAVVINLLLLCPQLFCTREGRQIEHGFLSDVQNMGMYEGQMIDGQPHGNGTIIYLANDKFGRANYTGEWRFGMITGVGTMIWKSGAK